VTTKDRTPQSEEDRLALDDLRATLGLKEGMTAAEVVTASATLGGLLEADIQSMNSGAISEAQARRQLRLYDTLGAELRRALGRKRAPSQTGA